MLGSICPLHKVAAFGAPDDRRLAVHLFCVDEEDNTPNQIPQEVLKGFRRSPAVLGRLVMNFTKSKKVNTRQEIHISPEASDTCADILELVLEKVFQTADENIRRQRIKDLYGSSSNLGIISPSEWPRQQDDSDSAKAVSSSEESDDAQSVSTCSSNQET